MFKKLFLILATLCLTTGVSFAGGWSCSGSACTKQIVFTSGGAATADFDTESVMNLFMMPVQIVASADDSVVVTLIGSTTGRDYLDGNGTLADATTPQAIDTDDRWIIGETMVPTISGLGSGTVTLIFSVSK